MATKLQIYNGALRRLGNPLLVSLADENSARRYLDAAWDDGLIDFVLDRGKWSFAKRSLQITFSTTIIPAFGFKYAFEEPDDFIKLVSLWLDQNFLAPLRWYEYEAGIFYTNEDTIYLQYISNALTFGGNLARWPSAFTQYVQTYMALQAEPFITNSKTINNELEKDLLIAERMALTSDGLNKPIQINPIGTWNRARLFNYPSNGVAGIAIGGNSSSG